MDCKQIHFSSKQNYAAFDITGVPV